MKELDPGHRYELLTLDGETRQELRFVKRVGDRYPGNTELQNIIRDCYARVAYIDQQASAREHLATLQRIEDCLWLLKGQAAGEHTRPYRHAPIFACPAPMCEQCGHTDCEHAREEEQ